VRHGGVDNDFSGPKLHCAARFLLHCKQSLAVKNLSGTAWLCSWSAKARPKDSAGWRDLQVTLGLVQVAAFHIIYLFYTFHWVSIINVLYLPLGPIAARSRAGFNEFEIGIVDKEGAAVLVQ
jgi:hypothetical protein